MATLTPLQKRIARLVYRGCHLPEIAASLYPLTERQVRRQIELMYKALSGYPGTARQRITLWQRQQQ